MIADKSTYFEGKLKTIPKFPRIVPPYRVHWNWDVSYKCNYKCSYCEVMKRDEEFKYQPLDIGLWTEVFDRIFKLYWSSHFRFSGGEPTIYPRFLDFLGILLEKNTADITTNLSFNFNEFLDKVPPNRGLSISSSFHSEYDDMQTFLEKVKHLHFNGYPSTISFVGYPPFLKKIPEYKKLVEGEGIYFKIIPFSGEYKGQFYPDAYSESEKRLLEGLAQDSEDEHLNEMNTRWYEHLVEKKDVPEKIIKKGKLCSMGHMYAIIHPDLEVTRCCAGYHGRDSGILGIITDENFKLLNKPEPCRVEYKCPCFKAMLVDDKNNNWVEFWEALEHPVYRTEYMIEYADYLKNESEQ